MTFTALTPRWRSSSRRTVVSHLLGLLGLVLVMAACSTSPTSIGVGLPSADANTGAYLIDTFTVRASTVLRDSVPSSSSSYLLVGRASDPLLGTLRAVSAFRVGLTAPFIPQASYVLDSVTLLVTPDNAHYRYGDTTQLQSLARVYRLQAPLSTTVPLYTSDKYTTLSYDATTLLNKTIGGVSRVPLRRASPGLRSIRIPLDVASVGGPIMAAGKAGQLSTQDQLLELLPGLVIAPDDSDQGALVRLSANDGGLVLYYHDPADPSTVLNSTFTIANGGRHCFQVKRTGGPATLPTTTLGFTYASATGEQTFVQGALGLQTRLEFPYLNDLRQFGQNLTITSAQLTAEVPPTTLSQYLPPPPNLTVYTSNILRQPVASYLASVAPQTATSPTTALNVTSYSLPLTGYVQAVLSGVVPNNGLLLASATPELPTRVALGGPRHPTNRLRLRLYLISAN